MPTDEEKRHHRDRRNHADAPDQATRDEQLHHQRMTALGEKGKIRLQRANPESFAASCLS